MEQTALIEVFKRLGLALALGILIGAERGWQTRAEPEGSRVAGIRTFGIIGLLGGLWVLLADALGAIVLGFAFAAFAGVMVVVRVRAMGATGDYGATTIVAALLTFAFGGRAVVGPVALGLGACAVGGLAGLVLAARM